MNYKNKKPQPELIIVIETFETVFDVVVHIHAKGNYDNNNHIEFVKNIAIGCNYAGIALSDAIKFITDKYKIEDNASVFEIVQIVYKQYEEEHGTKALMYNLKVRNHFDNEDWLRLPYIPDEVFDNLPPILQKAASAFSDKRERDTFLTGAIVVLSGLLSHVHGTYLGRTIYPNLYCFIVAPAGSGKGSLLYAKELGMPFHDYRREQLGSNNLLFIPTNISTASLYQQLELSQGVGILFESEADTMAGSFKQEWGGYSDILRKAFHHESISLKRKDKEKETSSYIEVKSPRLSVALSGTTSQVRGIIPNSEDGLFSRFIIYTFRSEPYWNMEADMNNFSYDDFFQEISIKLSDIINNLSIAELFSLTDEQKQIFHSRFRNWQNEFILFFEEESISIIRRLAVITFRIAMILTFIREGHIGRIEQGRILYCNDMDFNLAFLLAETYKHHSLYAFVKLGKDKTKGSVLDKKVQMFYDNLPDIDFQRALAVQIGKEKVELEERTVDKYLKKLLLAGYLIQPHYGTYKKS
ncbi:DUF3987 domain-containing protein [Dysgonomonas reticulitermitis]